MPKSYLSGAAKRSAPEERAKQIAEIPKMSAFLKPADSAPPPMKLIKILSPKYYVRTAAERLGNLSLENEQRRVQTISYGAKLCNGGLGRSPEWGHGAKPLFRGTEEVPLKLTFSYFRD